MSKVTLAKLIKSLEDPRIVYQDGRVYWGDSSIILVDDPRLFGYFRRVYGMNIANSEKDGTHILSEFDGDIGMVPTSDPSQTLKISGLVQKVSETQKVLKALEYCNLRFFDGARNREQIAFGLGCSRKNIVPSENLIWVDKLKAEYISEVFDRFQTQLFMVRTMREEWMRDIVLTPWFMLSDHPSWLFYMINTEEVRAAIRLEDEEGTVFGGALTAKYWEDLFQEL